MEISSNVPGPQVAYLRRKWRLNYFVETGTARGDTAELAAITFDRVFTCEIDPALAAAAKTRLAPYPHVQVFQMESPQFLRQIKPQLDQPTLYWLDAHWCGGPVRPSKECPLLEELAEIGSLHGHSVILIDDLNYVFSPPPPPHRPDQWPTISAVQNALASWGVTTSIVAGPRTQIMVVTPQEA